MSHKLEWPKSLDPKKLKWGRPDEPVSYTCSCCGDHIPEDACPLRMWNASHWALVFCDHCATVHFKAQGFDQAEPQHEPEVREANRKAGKK